jgi:hypothetical protein
VTAPEEGLPGEPGLPVRTQWRWLCFLCLDGGPADSADHAAALERTHRHYACPKAPGLRRPAPPKPGSTYVPWDELGSREAWHKILMERYGGPWPEPDLPAGT